MDVDLAWQVPSEPVIVRAEPNGIAAMLRALADNAVDAMGERGTIRVSLAVVSLPPRRQHVLGLRDAPAYAEIRVSDTGMGMTGEQQAKAFEPYYSTRNRAGLGLPLVYGFSRRFNGAVEVGETSPAGTTIHLYFPIATDAPA